MDIATAFRILARKEASNEAKQLSAIGDTGKQMGEQTLTFLAGLKNTGAQAGRTALGKGLDKVEAGAKATDHAIRRTVKGAQQVAGKVVDKATAVGNKSLDFAKGAVDRMLPTDPLEWTKEQAKLAKQYAERALGTAQKGVATAGKKTRDILTGKTKEAADLSGTMRDRFNDGPQAPRPQFPAKLLEGDAERLSAPEQVTSNPTPDPDTAAWALSQQMKMSPLKKLYQPRAIPPLKWPDMSLEASKTAPGATVKGSIPSLEDFLRKRMSARRGK